MPPLTIFDAADDAIDGAMLRYAADYAMLITLPLDTFATRASLRRLLITDITLFSLRHDAAFSLMPLRFIFAAAIAMPFFRLFAFRHC